MFSGEVIFHLDRGINSHNCRYLTKIEYFHIYLRLIYLSKFINLWKINHVNRAYFVLENFISVNIVDMINTISELDEKKNT